jgi:hypothetical protein
LAPGHGLSLPDSAASITASTPTVVVPAAGLPCNDAADNGYVVVVLPRNPHGPRRVVIDIASTDTNEEPDCESQPARLLAVTRTGVID